MLTIIILTFDRSEYLNRILNYYANLQVKYPIVVSDASNKQFLKQNTKLINSLNNKINIIHDIYPSNTYHFEAFLGSLEKIDTKYHVFLADDDFIVPRGIKNAVDFLEKHPSFEAAQGKQLSFSTVDDAAFSSDVVVRQLKMLDKSIEGKNAGDRIKIRMGHNTRLGNPKLSFAVKKTSTTKRIFKEMFSLGVDNSNNEKVIDILTLISGNIKLLDTLFNVRQLHNENYALKAFVTYTPIIFPTKNGEYLEPLVDRQIDQKKRNRPDYFDQLIDPLFPEQYNRMTNCFVNELVRQDKISFDEASEVIKYWVWYFMAKNMMPKFYAHGGSKYLPETAKVSLQKKIKEWAKEKPYIKKFWYRYSEGKMSLDSLLSTNSRYHNDFMPIYKAITVRPPDYKDHFDI